MSSPVPWADAVAILRAAQPVPAALMHFENEAFTRPDDGAVWISVESAGNVAQAVELGGGGWQETGTLFVHVMAPTGTGSTASRVVAKSVVDAFRGLGSRLVTYGRASVGGGGVASDDGLWWRFTASVEWRFQDTT